jgi:hypothetical protein
MSTSPIGSITKSFRRSSKVVRVIWIVSGVPCDSILLAMFTVLEAGDGLCGVALEERRLAQLVLRCSAPPRGLLGCRDP